MYDDAAALLAAAAAEAWDGVKGPRPGEGEREPHVNHTALSSLSFCISLLLFFCSLCDHCAEVKKRRMCAVEY